MRRLLCARWKDVAISAVMPGLELQPLPWWGGVGEGSFCAYLLGLSNNATTSTWADHRNWSIGVTERSR